jgi:CDGSH-type Zn-finger protein/mannose-6-phosphate isomerase-like protein (cupin superfamily)
MSNEADAPMIAARKGFLFELKAGTQYLWCRCGRSGSQPFCDGSHLGTAFRPIAFRAARDEEVILCGCKHTGTAPLCDGTHSNLAGGYAEDDPESGANRAVELVAANAGPTVQLDGQCCIFSTARATLERRGTLRYCTVVSPARGAQFQSQFYAELEAGVSPVIAAEQRHTVLFITSGRGEIELNGHRIGIEPLTGVYVRPGEAYRLHNPHAKPLKFFISNGPGSEDLAFGHAMPLRLEDSPLKRRAEIDPQRRRALAQRYFQLLINREHGSEVMTQFIGNIPLSKAEPHRHLYEEALLFLNGAGVVWTQHTKGTVGPGDVVFLPRKQVHSVQCTSPGGFDVVGVIYPGDNPAINY